MRKGKEERRGEGNEERGGEVKGKGEEKELRKSGKKKKGAK